MQDFFRTLEMMKKAASLAPVSFAGILKVKTNQFEVCALFLILPFDW